MNYEKIYDQIIQRAKSENRKKRCGIYYEAHHIVPRCIGGSDDKLNLILLTAKEHYIAHRLLVLIYPYNNKLKSAIWAMMIIDRTDNNKRYIPSGRIYAQIRELYASMPISNESRLRMSESKTGIPLPPRSKEHIKNWVDSRRKRYLDRQNLKLMGTVQDF